MKIYIDSAQVSTWTLPAGCPAIVGATTNPTLVYQAGLPVNLPTYLYLVKAAADHGFAELMVQLPSPDVAQTLQWLDTLRAQADRAELRLTIKLPCHADWLPCIHSQSVRCGNSPAQLSQGLTSFCFQIIVYLRQQ